MFDTYVYIYILSLIIYIYICSRYLYFDAFVKISSAFFYNKIKRWWKLVETNRTLILSGDGRRKKNVLGMKRGRNYWKGGGSISHLNTRKKMMVDSMLVSTILYKSNKNS